MATGLLENEAEVEIAFEEHGHVALGDDGHGIHIFENIDFGGLAYTIDVWHVAANWHDAMDDLHVFHLGGTIGKQFLARDTRPSAEHIHVLAHHVKEIFFTGGRARFTPVALVDRWGSGCHNDGRNLAGTIGTHGNQPRHWPGCTTHRGTNGSPTT